jgi:hypothetical protein
MPDCLQLPAPPRVALLAAPHCDDHALSDVLARALGVPVLVHAVRPDRPPPSACGLLIAASDPQVRLAVDRACATLWAVKAATDVLATAGRAWADPVHPGRVRVREVVVRMVRPAPDGPAYMQVGEAWTDGPRPDRPWHESGLGVGIEPGRAALVWRAAVALAHHADRRCPGCGLAGFGATARCVVCRTGARARRSEARVAARPRAYRVRRTSAAWTRFPAERTPPQTSVQSALPQADRLA